MEKYTGPYSDVNGTYGGTDDLGRTLSTSNGVPLPRRGKTVGMFYYLAPGNHGLKGPYDNNKIVMAHPDATESEEKWIAAGGGPLTVDHHWGEPLFGYYSMHDEWVIRKHMQMLTDAGVDYLVFDTTNALSYDATALKVLKVLDEFYQRGITNVPKIAYYTNSASGKTINHIYHSIYREYPQYGHLWFRWEGKPLIIGLPTDPELEEEAKAFFRIKMTRWPNQPREDDDQWPWVEFGDIYTDNAVYGRNGRKEVINVSTAQHCDHVFSASAWYGAPNRTKSYRRDIQANDPDPDAVKWGYNFADQWRWAMEQDPETIFVTQWNEWLAMRFHPMEGHPIVFVDLADPNNSRDIEPMRGGYGDNYYMQLCEFVRQYKGAAPRVNASGNTTISISGSFRQWDGVAAVYRDYIGDTAPRDQIGFGNHRYTDDSGRNDFDLMKVAKDEENIYFYVRTAESITSSCDKNWMTLFLNSGNAGTTNWYGFDYIVNRVSPEDNKAVVERCIGGWNWEPVGAGDMKVVGNELMLCIPREWIGVPESVNQGLLNLQFKWADNYVEDDIWSFYEKGDAAPIGRLTYIFSEIK